MVLEIEGLNYIWSITCPTCPCDMFDMFLWYVRHVPLVCSTCSFDMFSMFLQYVQHAHNTCSSCKNYMYLHVLPHVPCSMCMFFSGGPAKTTERESLDFVLSEFLWGYPITCRVMTFCYWRPSSQVRALINFIIA